MSPHDARTDGSVIADDGSMVELERFAHDPHPRKTRRIEWVGEESPLENPIIAFNLATHRYTPTQAKVIRLAAVRARTRVRRERLLAPDVTHAQAAMAGLRRVYHWTADNDFIVDVDYEDVDRIIGDPNIGHEFRDLDAGQPRPASPFQVPPLTIVLVSEERVLTTEALAGAVIARTSNAAGGSAQRVR